MSNSLELLVEGQPHGPRGAHTSIPIGIFIAGRLIHIASQEISLAELQAVGLWH